MKYTILGFNQAKAINLQKEQDGKVRKLDVIDLLILQDVADIMNRSKFIKYTIDDKVYFSIQYSAIIEDLPIIDIKKQALSDRLDKMCFLGLLEKKIVKNQSGTWVAFRMGSEYEKLIYEPTSSEIRVQEYSTTTHNTNNTNNNINNKEVIEDKSSITKKDETSEFVEYIYSLYPTKCPRRNVSLGKCAKDKERIKHLLKQYTKEDIERVVKNEVDEKYGKSYMSKFATFLNNFPDPACVEPTNLFPEEKNDEIVVNGIKYR